jgi:uncharacterized repeat protein (TIGR01451 family)
VVEVPDDTTGTFTNTVEVEGTHPTGTITDTDEAPVVVTDPEVALTKDTVPPGAVDGIITFTIRITNTGPSTLEQVPLIDHFSGPIVYLPERSSPPADIVDNTAQELGWTDLTANTEYGFGRNLPPGEFFVITTVFSLTEYTERFTMTNVATVTTESGDVATDVFDNPANEAYDDEILTDVPTAVELLYFQGERQEDDVILRWATAVEIDNFGFRLLRSSTGSLVDAVEIGLVPGQGRGTASGASYTFIDEEVEPDQTYTYWLVDVDVNGNETTHEPVTIDSVGLDEGNSSTIYLPLIFK